MQEQSGNSICKDRIGRCYLTTLVLLTKFKILFIIGVILIDDGVLELKVKGIPNTKYEILYLATKLFLEKAIQMPMLPPWQKHYI